jgi:broad specificity phosphatase PhoE
MSNSIINYAFIRHGFGCHNSIKSLYSQKVFTRKQLEDAEYSDPELTPLGVDASISNGCIINKTLKKLGNNTSDNLLSFNEINIVGCSPLIRSMETAYFMSRQWSDPPTKIYVFPYLREIDESSKDKFTEMSFIRMETEPSYAMKTIEEQKAYLFAKGILQFFDFSFIENFSSERKAPGDIPMFITWFTKHFLPLFRISRNLNVYIVTHAGVLRDYFHEGFPNNAGGVVSTYYFPLTKRILRRSLSLKPYIIRRSLSLKPYLSSNFFTDYNSYATTEYYCPSQRCSFICKHVKSSNIKSINFNGACQN